jgi:hypothetical protein
MVEVKVKFPHHTHEIIWRSEHAVAPISSHFVFALLLLYRHGNNSGYPLTKKLGCPQGRFGRFGEEMNPLFVQGLEPLLPRILVTVPTTLFRLRKNVCYITRDMDKVFGNREVVGCC